MGGRSSSGHFRWPFPIAVVVSNLLTKDMAIRRFANPEKGCFVGPFKGQVYRPSGVKDNGNDSGKCHGSGQKGGQIRRLRQNSRSHSGGDGLSCLNRARPKLSKGLR